MYNQSYYVFNYRTGYYCNFNDFSEIISLEKIGNRQPVLCSTF